MCDIRCKLCANVHRCPSSNDPETCRQFKLDLNESAELANSLAKEYAIDFCDALDIIKLGLQYGGLYR